MIITQVTENSLVIKSNLILPRLAGYNLNQLRLIAFCLAHYQPGEKDNKLVHANSSEMAEIFQIEPADTYIFIRRLVRNLSPVEFKSDTVTTDVFWFTSFSFDDRNGDFTFKINSDMEQYLLRLKREFSYYLLSDVNKFRSAHTWILFEHLNRWKNAGTWQIGIDILKEFLDISGKYQLFESFRNYVIDPAISDINEKTRLNVSYIKIKKIKTVTAIRFFISAKNNESLPPIDAGTKKSVLIKMLIDCGFKINQAEILVDKISFSHDEDHFIKKIPQIKDRWCTEKGSLPKYVRGSINKEMRCVKESIDVKNEPLEVQAQFCYFQKKRKNLTCKVIVENKIPYRHKCKICFEMVKKNSLLRISSEDLDKKLFNEFIEHVKINDTFIYEFYSQHGRNAHMVQHAYHNFIDKWMKFQGK